MRIQRILIICTALLVCLFASLAGCTDARQRAGAGVGALIDCEAPNLAKTVAELVPLAKQAVLALIGPDGKVDTSKLKAAGAGIVSDLGRCALATAVAILATPPTSGHTIIAQPLLVPDPGALRAAFEDVRTAWGGASFKTRGGTI